MFLKQTTVEGGLVAEKNHKYKFYFRQHIIIDLSGAKSRKVIVTISCM